ncbi:MAG: hypothetical protein H8E85_00760 [Candidatus Marinimicrobia bacterium]|nr:hypothetical protein [Candidatus Neomarinimicrobiota bacterium]
MQYLLISLLLSFGFAVNFSEDISPIVYQNCTTCHRSGEIASFLPLTNFSEVYNNRNWIAYAIAGDDSRHGNPIMPPWPPDNTYSALIGERSLSEVEIHTILDWVDEGAPQGNPNLEFPMPDFPEGSAIGEPDVVLSLEEPYFIEGNNQDDYRCFIIETNFSEDKDIAAIEIYPGNRVAVHHAILVATPAGSADALDELDSGPGYECFGGFGTPNISDILGGYAPGMIVSPFPSGLAQNIPANSDLIIQLHYAPLNTDEIDQTTVNIFFRDEPVERYVQEEIMYPWQLVFPPNELTTISESWNISNDISLIQFFPHSHMLGKSWEIYAETPDNSIIPIIRINEWDFDWQSFYSPEYMLHIPSGSTITANCVYDNTSDNPNNPNDPPEWVFFGEGTNDEMFFVPYRYVNYQVGDEYIYLGTEESLTGDVNGDGDLNVLDVVSLVGFILNGEFDSSADVNEDGLINVLDVVSLVNIILS